jgi:predicted DNA-binding transcriptional regulator YafY
MNFEPSGDLLTDIANCITNSNCMQIDYIDRKGVGSNRKIAPFEVRGDRFYAADLDVMGLRVFLLGSVQSFAVLDETFDKNSLVLT